MGISRRFVVAVAVVLVGWPLGAHTPVRAAVSGQTMVAHPLRVSPHRTVNVRQLPAGGSHATRPVIPQLVTPAYVPRSPSSGPTARVRSPLAGPHAGYTATPGTPTERVLATFPGAERSTLVATFGADQDASPPDPQVAVGADTVVEQVNSAMLIFDKSGTLLLTTDLYTLYSVPVGDTFSDPRILYDPGSQRYFASGVIVDPAPVTPNPKSTVVLAVSATSDPRGYWFIYNVNKDPTAVDDQPKLAVTADKVVLSWTDVTGTTLTGQETAVLEKADVINSAPVLPRAVAFGPSIAQFGMIPAQRPAAFSDAIAAYNHSTDPATGLPYPSPQTPYVGIVTITGTPAQNNVVPTEVDVPFGGTSTPTPAQQPSGTLATNDDRFLSAVWQNNQVWLAGNDACTPTGDTTPRTCPRIVAVATPGSLSLTQNFNIGALGWSYSFPAIALDPAGNLFAVFTASSATDYPEVVSTTMAAGGQTLSPEVVLAPGAGNYSDAPSTTNRWGDYSAATPDPTNPAEIWMVGEFAPSTSTTKNWGTEIGRVTLAPSTYAQPIRRTAVMGGDGAMWVLQDNGAFASYGGRLLGAPAVVVVPGSPSVTYYVVTGADHHLWYRTDSANWQLFSGAAYCLDNPAALWNPATAVFTVACTGGDHALWDTSLPLQAGDAPYSDAFASLGGYLSYGPAMTLVNGQVDFLVTGRDPQVWERTISQGFHPTGWMCIGHPAAGSTGGIAYFGCHGTDGALWVSRNFGGGWEAARSAGGRLIDGPGVAASSALVQFSVEGTDRALWQTAVDANGNGTGFVGRGGILVGGAGAGGL